MEQNQPNQNGYFSSNGQFYANNVAPSHPSIPPISFSEFLTVPPAATAPRHNNFTLYGNQQGPFACDSQFQNTPQYSLNSSQTKGSPGYHRVPQGSPQSMPSSAMYTSPFGVSPSASNTHGFVVVPIPNNANPFEVHRIMDFCKDLHPFVLHCGPGQTVGIVNETSGNGGSQVGSNSVQWASYNGVHPQQQLKMTQAPPFSQYNFDNPSGPPLPPQQSAFVSSEPIAQSTEDSCNQVRNMLQLVADTRCPRPGCEGVYTNGLCVLCSATELVLDHDIPIPITQPFEAAGSVGAIMPDLFELKGEEEKTEDKKEQKEESKGTEAKIAVGGEESDKTEFQSKQRKNAIDDKSNENDKEKTSHDQLVSAFENLNTNENAEVVAAESVKPSK